MAFCMLSCASVKCTFFCEQQEYTIYVDDQELGNGLVQFVAPHGTSSVLVQVKNNGVLIYENTYYVKDYHKNELITISIPTNYKYSSTPKFHN